MIRGRRLVLLLAVVALVAMGGVLTFRHLSSAHAQEVQCQRITAEAAALREDQPVTTGGPVAVVLGDSWAAGTFLTDPRTQAWPTLLGHREGWTTYLNAVGGTGFVNGGACGGQDYRSRVAKVLALHPQIVVVEGGLNDDAASPAQVEAAERRVLDGLRAVPEVFIVGPASVPARPHSAAISAALAHGAGAARYISMQGVTLPLRPDGLHMTAAGHPILAAAVASRLRAGSA